MFERYNEKARQTIFFARYEISEFGAPIVETEHLLLGLLRADESLIPRLLPANITIDTIRKHLQNYMLLREKFSTLAEVRLSVAAKNVLRHAHEEADSLSHKSISTEHLLLGLLREEGSLASKILAEIGVEYAATRQKFEN